jgi:hypothetical protein
LKQIVVLSFLLIVLYKSVEPAIIYFTYLRSTSEIEYVPEFEGEKLSINHHADLDVQPLDTKPDLNITLSGNRVTQEKLDHYNEKMKEFFDQENQKNKRNSFAGFDQMQNYLCPDYCVKFKYFHSKYSKQFWVYNVEWDNIHSTVFSPPPQA